MGPPTKTYKPIQPAPSKRDRSGGTSGRSDPVVIINSIDRPTKRLKAVLQACHTCRKFKARCDGQRPVCGGCQSRGKTCGYEGSEGQSRQAAVKTRMEHFVKCWTALQTSSSDEALELFNRIRAGEDEMALLNSSNGAAASGASHGSSTGGGPTAASRSSASTSGSGSDTGPLPSSLSRASRSVSDALLPALPMSEYSSSSLTLVQSSTSPSQIRVGTAAYLFQFVLPSAESIWSGIQSFFGSSGKLFHVFSQPQAEEYYKTVFGFDGRPNHKQRKAICCLCIIAAIGVQYNPSDFEQDMDDLLYNVARQFFADVIEDSPLEAIKVCTLLAMYNIMNKATAALAYIEVGLSMSKRQGEATGVSNPTLLSQDEWVDFRKTWRTLVFFSGWLSSTLGYISGPDRDDAAFEKLVPLAETEHDIYTVEIGEMVQAEMTKISLLKASILRTRLIKELTSSGIDGIVKELQEWHGRLPRQMQLATLGDFDIPSGVRWSIYHVHLLYLGAIILVYRRVAAQCMRASSRGDRLALDEHNNALMGLVELGVNAARDSARILNLLHADKGIFRRCWLVIFQAHTSCVVILHSVAQKQLHKFPASSWAEDMKRAQHCLDVLEFCGTIDAVALRFRIKLSSFYNELSATGAEQHTNMQRVADWVQLSPDPSSDGTPPTPTVHLRPSDYLLTIPREADQHLQDISYSLMFAICRPWGEVENMTACSGADVANLMLEQGNADHGNESSADRSKLLAQLDWSSVQKAQPFQWDLRSIVDSPKAPEVEIQEAMFLGSEAPSGWSSTPYIEVDEA